MYDKGKCIYVHLRVPALHYGYSYLEVVWGSIRYPLKTLVFSVEDTSEKYIVPCY